MAAGSGSGGRGFSLPIEFIYGKDSPVQELISQFNGGDPGAALAILTKQWISSVGDLRLVAQEGQLRMIGLPLRLCLWIEEEVWRFKFLGGAGIGIGAPDKDEEANVNQQPVIALQEIVCKHEKDFDGNGVFYLLGTMNKRQQWQNPMNAGLVEVTSSGTTKDSVPMACIVGREAVRCVTLSQEHPWFLVDLKENSMRPTAYTLRHYSSWDTECLRYWRFEGSPDLLSWVLLREHVNDEALNGKGSTHTWHIDTPAYYRAFRIVMTGLNSNKHLYMALSGLELYGWLRPAPKLSLAFSNNASPPVNLHPKGKATHIFMHVTDFDENGIIHNIGTWGGSRPWQNPAISGLIQVTASSLMGDSTPESALLGKEVVRCVTKPLPKSWFTIDFLDKMVMPTHYSLRHYSSWDMEALRNWRFEGSSDGSSWESLVTHNNDSALNARGSTWTWAIPSSKVPYRIFRIFQTGENSNKHHYLALSGFELYGHLLKLDGSPIDFAAPSPLPSSQLQGPKTFVPTGDFDEQGIIYFLGTNEKRGPYRNPASQGIVKVTASAMAGDSEPISAVCGREVVRCVTSAAPKSWIAVDLVDKLVIPTHYTLRHYATWDTEALRCWILEASTDGAAWDVLREHVEDTSLNGRGCAHTWPLDVGNAGPYQIFRITQTAINSNKHHYLACSGFELYGTLYRREHWNGAFSPPQPRGAGQQQQQAPPVVGKDIRAVKSMDFNLGGNVPPPNPSPSNANQKPSVSSGAGAGAGASGKDLARSKSADEVNGDDDILYHGDMEWDGETKNKALSVKGSLVKNTGSTDKWQLVRSKGSFDGGRHMIGIKITSDPKTSNTWRFIVGAIPDSMDVLGNKQWVGALQSWGYIAGTGGKCSDTPRSIPYGAKLDLGDVVNILLDFPRQSVEFFKNGVSQGVAFTNLAGRVHIAASLTATDGSLQLCSPLRLGPAPRSPRGSGSGGVAEPWDTAHKSPFLTLNGNVVTNSGSSDKWQSVRSVRPLVPTRGGNGKCVFEVEFLTTPKTPNSWQVIVGVVPVVFTCSGTKQWVGALGGWGYIGGTGGICHDDPRNTPYGETFGKQGDVIRVTVNFMMGTIEFSKNGNSQGIAFRDLQFANGPYYAAVSLTATGAQAKLKFISN